MMFDALVTAGAFTVGNFIYQAATSQDWMRALDISVFQWMAVLWFAYSHSRKD